MKNDDIPVEFYNLKQAGRKHHPRAKTVGQLMKHLAKLPPELPVKSALFDEVELVVYNNVDHALSGPHLEIIEPEPG